MALRGIRGATSVDANIKEEILKKTHELLENMMTKNSIKIEDIASVFFSMTPDLNATFPAIAARELGMTSTPLLCFNEINVPSGLPFCIRILIQVNSDQPQNSFEHIYLNKAVTLRPDIAI